MDLFRHNADRRRLGQPLAERMRPTSLKDYLGQGHLLGPGKLLTRVLSGTDLPSLILWGPPGTGKTTLARILAEHCDAEFAPMSAVMAGVKDVREVVAKAAVSRDHYGRKTILFLDEIHRFSKAQQDALLPHVEAGTITLIGATTENPSFEVNAPLLSRCRVLRLDPLAAPDLVVLGKRALGDPNRGLGELEVTAPDDLFERLAEMVHGDARRLLNTLEIAAKLAAQEDAKVIGSEHIDEAMQQKLLVYDKAGDEHYGVVSALIKSMRGSDPDAAVYWMTRMLEAGEDPLFILRRLVIFASEDVGNADPQALTVATSAMTSFRFIGLPEGVLPMTQAVTYLACAPKSNTALTTYAASRKVVRERGALPVPKKLLNAVTSLNKSFGHGKDYKYPHNFAGQYVAESYLPDAIDGLRFYEPTDSGYEREIGERLADWRAQRDAGDDET